MKNLSHLQNFKGNPHKKQGGWVAIGALIVAVVGLATSYDQGQIAQSQADEAAAANRRAIQAQERAANVKAQQERIKTLREARIARAQLLSGATSAGLGAGSSGVSGGTSSITSQAGANIGAINVAQTFAQEASLANQQSATINAELASTQAKAAQWQAIGNIGMQQFGSQGGFKTIFSKDINKAK